MHSIRIYLYLVIYLMPAQQSAVRHRTSTTCTRLQLPPANNLPTLSFCHPSQTLRSQSSSQSHSRPPNTHSVYMPRLFFAPACDCACALRHLNHCRARSRNVAAPTASASPMPGARDVRTVTTRHGSVRAPNISSRSSPARHVRRVRMAAGAASTCARARPRVRRALGRQPRPSA